MLGPDADDPAGLHVRQSPPAEPGVTVDGDASLAQLHRSLLEAGLSEPLLAALRGVPGQDRGDHRRALRDVGVDALEGRLAGALARAVEVLPTAGPPHPDDRDVVQDALATLYQVGSGHVDGQPSPAADVLEALPPLFANSEVSPTVTIRLGVSWASRPRDQRADVLELLADLALGAEVVLVATDAAAARIRDDHADLVPAWVLTKLADRRGDEHGPAAERAARQAAADAREVFRTGAQPTAVLRHLSRLATHSLTYDRLASRMALDSAPYEATRRLEDHGLVERMDRADGERVVSLRPAGLAYLSSLDAEAAADGGLSSSTSSAGLSSSGSAGPVSHDPQNPPDMPCYPSSYDPPARPGAGPDADGDRPAVEAVSAADGDRRDRYHGGRVWPRYADRVDWLPATEAVDQGELALVDVDLDSRLDEDRDGRVPFVSYDEDAAEVYVGAEYSNPMAFAVRLAHGLTSERLFSSTDLADRLGDDLEGLDIKERALLWSAVCLGWLPEDVETGEDYVDELRDARDGLCERSGLANVDDSDVTRSSVTSEAIGLVGTMVHLYDLAGVDVVLEARVPETSRHFGAAGNSSRREDFLKNLGMLTSVTSRAGAFSVYRQLFENRPDRRSDAFNPGFGSDKHPRDGSMRAGFVVTGDGAEELVDDVVDAVGSPREVHEDAPEISVDVDVRTGVDRERFSSTVKRALRMRGLRPTPAASMVLRAFCASSWDAVEGILLGLETEVDRRDVDLVEVRRALGVLEADRLLPDVTGSARAGVAALLDADRPLSQAELARRAGISTQSWRNHREGLVDADVVREVDDGWRLALPFASERWDDVDVADPPWYLAADAEDAPAGSADPHTRKVTDVLWWLAERGVLDAAQLLDEDDPIGHAVATVGSGISAVPRGAEDRGAARAALEAAGVPPDVVLAGCQCPPPDQPVARMGRSTRQTTLA